MGVQRKFEKKLKKSGKTMFLTVVGDALGVFLEYQTTQKNYSEVVTTKKKVLRIKFRNDGSIRNKILSLLRPISN